MLRGVFLPFLLSFATLAVAADRQKITVLTPRDVQRLAAQRAVVERHLADERSKQNYATAAGKLGLLRALIERRIVEPADSYKLQSMGVVLGDAFVQELKLEWVIVEDSQGRDPALRVPRTSILLFPLTMISKRIESGEAVDVFELFNGVAERVESLKKERGLR
jgi:hypothetical protein